MSNRVLGTITIAAIVLAGAIVIYSRYGAPLPDRAQWQMSDQTMAWLGRGCADIDFSGGVRPGFETVVDGMEVTVTFNDEARTRFSGRLHGRALAVRQTLPTTEVGRFCGSDIQVHMHLRVSRAEPHHISGNWRLSGCDLCKDRRIEATLVD